MITFKKPMLQEMESGLKSLELTEEGTWESFPKFAKKLVQQLKGKIIEKHDGPDVRIWEISINNVILNLVYDDFPNGVSIEPKNNDGAPIINELYELFKSQSNENGL